jgi:hypothetical protein
MKLLPSPSPIITPRQTYHSQAIRAYLLHMIIRDSISPEENIEELLQKLELDKDNTRYLQGHVCIPKWENLSLAWEYAQNPADHQRCINMLRVSPQVFQALLRLIEDHPVFQIILMIKLSKSEQSYKTQVGPHS